MLQMTPEELWNLPAEEFNKWRRENDLIKLFDCFKKNLPQFDEWLKVHKFNVDFLINTNKPGAFFYGDKETILIKSDDQGFDKYFFIPIEDKYHDKRLSIVQKEEKDKIEHFRFRPYFKWAKEKLKTDKIIKTKYSGKLDTFRYIGGTAPNVPENCSAIISPGIEVLKLGGTKINGWGFTTSRNLDFTNLDFLEIDGKYHWDIEHNIFYSSCRHIKFTNCAVNFTKFYACHFENLSSYDARFYWTQFFECDLFKASFENSSLVSFTLVDCSVNSFSFNRVEVDNLIYIPPKKDWYSALERTFENIMDNYKRFRVLYQNNGHRKEAGKAYFKERLYELKYNLESLHLRGAFKLISREGFNYSKPFVIENIKKLGSIIADSFSFALWGFGEKPTFTLLFSSALIIIFTFAYFFSGIENIGGEIINSVYLSSIVFSTLGFGDYVPFANDNFKLVISLEALLGAFSYGLLIAGYTNKSKY